MSKRKESERTVVVHKGGGSKMAKTKFVTEFNVSAAMAAGVVTGWVGLYPLTVPPSGCNRAVTVSGLRWNINHASGDAATKQQIGKWLIYIRRGAGTIPTLALPAAASVQAGFAGINPNDILVWGEGIVDAAGDMPMCYEGVTKTQRKMNEGDGLVFAYYVTNNAANTEAVTLYGMVQTFLKS